MLTSLSRVLTAGVGVDDIPEAKRLPIATQPAASPRLRWVGLLGLAIAIVGGSRLSSARFSSPKTTIIAESVSPDTADDITAAIDPTNDLATATSDISEPRQVLGHFAHAEAPLGELQAVGTFNGRTELLRPTAAARYREMVAAAATEGINLAIISGFRSIETQEFLFFQLAQAQAMRPQERALVSAPPGFSEHHTGYAIDIGDGNAPYTHLEESFADTAAYRWLDANAARFGFELSFPRDNPQGVMYEPWHWRFVGDSHSLETFYGSRTVVSNPSAD